MEKDIDEFLKKMGMPKEEKQIAHDEWYELIKRTTCNVILGKKGSGKSGLGYALLESLGAHYNLLPAVVNLPRDKQNLLPSNFIVTTLHGIKALENSIILIDEGTTMLPAGQAKLEEMVKGFQALSRQRNQIILFIFHASSDVGSRLLRGMDAILLKEPSLRQIQHGSKDSWWHDILLEAKGKFQTVSDMGEDTRKYTFVDCEEPPFRGLLTNPLPSFWSDELSCAWAGADTDTEGQHGLFHLPKAQKEKPSERPEPTTEERLNKEIGDLFPRGIDDEILDTVIEYDRKYTTEQLQAKCREIGVSTSGHKKLLAAKIIAHQREKRKEETNA